MLFLLAALPSESLGPIAILVMGVLVVVGLIAVVRLHAFFALMLGAIFTGIVAAAFGPDGQGLAAAVNAVMGDFGAIAGRVAFPIAMAAVIGISLMESGAADKIVRRFLAVFGEGKGALALLLSSFLLSAPVFVDTVFMLLLPLARAMSERTGGKNYLLYVLCIGAGGSVSNGLVPPAPGALVVAEMLHLDLGMTILFGMTFGLLPALGALAMARWFNARQTVPVRPLVGGSAAPMASTADLPESALPGLFAAITPVVLPIILMASGSVLALVRAGAEPDGWTQATGFFGNKNIALLVGAVAAVWVCARQRGTTWRDVGATLGRPLEVAGVIILITSAGAAFGATIKNAGVGAAVEGLVGQNSLNFVVLAWLMAAFIRAAQGSATVATITAISIVLSIAPVSEFGVHPFYVFAASGLGSKFLPWMNDSGFWVFSRLGGLTPPEMLRSWTILASLVSVLGLAEIWIASTIWPNLPF